MVPTAHGRRRPPRIRGMGHQVQRKEGPALRTCPTFSFLKKRGGGNDVSCFCLFSAQEMFALRAPTSKLKKLGFFLRSNGLLTTKVIIQLWTRKSEFYLLQFICLFYYSLDLQLTFILTSCFCFHLCWLLRVDIKCVRELLHVRYCHCILHKGRVLS